MKAHPPFLDLSALMNYGLLLVLLVVLVAVARSRSLLTAILLMSLFSFTLATWLLVMDAPDVAFTEAVVGAGVSTLLLLGAILLTRTETVERNWRQLVAPGLAAGAAAGLLIFAVTDLPPYGDPSAPAYSYVGRAYLEGVMHDIGAPNVVTAVLSSYRGFDTLGETTVIFAAVVAVTLLLGYGERSLGARPRAQLAIEGLRDSDEHVVLRVAAKMLIPMIAVFALYVQFHGDLGPGGGFQAGVILAVAVILHALVFGLSDTMAAIRPGFVRGVASLGVLLYAAIGVWNIVNGGVFLDYDYMFSPAFEASIPDSHLSGGHHHWGQHFGILGIELGVLFTVTAAMVAAFYAFAGRSLETEERQAAP